MHEIRPTVKRAVESLVVSATMPTKSGLLGDLTTVKECTKCSDLEYVHVAIANLKEIENISTLERVSFPTALHYKTF